MRQPTDTLDESAASSNNNGVATGTGEEAPTGRARIEPPDLSEKGGLRGGVPQRSNERLFMQLLAFGDCRDIDRVTVAVAAASLSAVVYEDLNDPRGIALLTLAGTPDLFVDEVRPLIGTTAFADLSFKPHYTMFGRTYSLGYEPDLADTLIHRPTRTVLHPDRG